MIYLADDKDNLIEIIADNSIEHVVLFAYKKNDSRYIQRIFGRFKINVIICNTLDELLNTSSNIVLTEKNNTLNVFDELCACTELDRDIKIYSEKNVHASGVINGKNRIIDSREYYKNWPWYFDHIYSDIPAEDRGQFIDEFPFLSGAFSNGVYYLLNEKNGKYVNVSGGSRITSYNKHSSCSHKIYVLGDSRIYGDGLPDYDTIPFLIQNHYPNCEVINLALPGNTLEYAFLRLNSLELNPECDVICSCIQSYYGLKPETTTGTPQMRASHQLYSIYRIYNLCRSHGANF